MSGAWRLDIVTTAFVDAAVNPARWDAAMDVVASATGAAGAALFPVKGRLLCFPQSASLMECSETYVRDGWIWRDERYRAWPTILRRGVGTDLDFTSADAIAHDPYYQDFLGRHGLRWFAAPPAAARATPARRCHWLTRCRRGSSDADRAAGCVDPHPRTPPSSVPWVSPRFWSREVPHAPESRVFDDWLAI